MDVSSANLTPGSLTALAEASAAINSTLDLDVVLDQIAKSAAEVMQAEGSSVLTLDRVRNKLIFTAAVGEQGRALLGKEFDADLGIAGHVIRTGRSENIVDVNDNPDFFRGIDEQLRFHTKGLMAAPMIQKAQIVGVVEVVNHKGGGRFPESSLPLLDLFANLAACGTHNALVHASMARERTAFRESVLADNEIVGSSTTLAATIKLADRVAPTHATVLLTGETGTGKEVLAKYIHKASQRVEKAFVAVNCAALPETLLESELFGHEKGAFTGAIQQRIGRFELADNGTLFLVGGTQTISCDVRIIAATNRDLKKGIEEGKFRDDLFYRLNVFPIHVPPLRDRRDDIPELVDHFTKLACANLGVIPHVVSQSAQAVLAAYHWPGNIRELSNVVERAVLLCDGAEILPTHLPSEIASARPAGTPSEGRLRGAERDMIVKALHEAHWNQTQAARALGISRDNLRYRLKKYNITRDDR